ncbi:thioredoxin family protein [Sphingomonas sp. JC676]|uniref:thioredoxin family protein n=1 Tax=Sphingomonas sp. JC676 TaxID=2768065 RepID=UPI0016581B79|nr:thioredoxin family protein [Sphingomonas sp. JC676]MBC9034905.1 thioredoxin family protein [Sphingomonas sp. JC676]
MRRGALVAALVVAVPALAAPSGTAPRLGAQSLLQLPRPLPSPYDSRADAARDFEAALARAKKSGKPVVVDFGANWCFECRVFAGVLALPDMRRYVARNFELVIVDIGRFDRNLDIAARYGAKVRAVPAVLVVDARSSKARNPRTLWLADSVPSHKPQEMADWLAKWAN